MLVLLVLGVATGADNQISGRENFRELFVGAERRRGFWQVSKGDWQGRWGKVGLHFPEPAQAWEDESRLSHQAVHELKMLTTMLLKLTETLGSLGRVAVDHVSRANSSYLLWHANAHAAAISFAWQSIPPSRPSAGPKLRKSLFGSGF